jgi:acetoin utilization protein AcuB
LRAFPGVTRGTRGALLEAPRGMRAQDIMTKNVWSIAPDVDADTAWDQMRKARIHHLVVVDDHHIVGILSSRDLGGPRGRSIRETKHVRDLMTPHAIVAAPEMPLRKVANLMRGQVIGCLPVVDGKQLVGIITTTDLLDLIGRGAENPTADSRRWVMKGRGPRRAAVHLARREGVTRG